MSTTWNEGSICKSVPHREGCTFAVLQQAKKSDCHTGIILRKLGTNKLCRKEMNEKQRITHKTDKLSMALLTNFTDTKMSRKTKRIQNNYKMMIFSQYKKSNRLEFQPNLSLIFQKCQVLDLYKGDRWYEGTITGVEFSNSDKQWMYNLSFSEWKATLASYEDPEIWFPFWAMNSVESHCYHHLFDFTIL